VIAQHTFRRVRLSLVALAAATSVIATPAVAQDATPAVEIAPVSCFPSQDGGWTHPYAHPQTEDPSASFYAVIEIPQGSINKYEYDEYGFLILDRVQSMPVTYPGNYGSIPSSAGGDGDPLDVLVLSRESIVPGTIVEVRAIAILHMIDGGELDDKIVAVPATDPDYDDITDISQLPLVEQQRIEQFFAVYKNLPEGRKSVELNGFSDGEAARTEVIAAIENYSANCE